MFKRIKEYFRKPQIGDIWYVQSENPFDNKLNKYAIVDIKGKWVQLKPANAVNYITEMIGTKEHSIRYLKQLYKREI